MVDDGSNAKHYKKLATASVGVLGCPRSPLYDPEVLAEITKQGRETMSRIRAILAPSAEELLVATDGGVFSGLNIETSVENFNHSSHLKLRIQGQFKDMILVNNNLYVLFNSVSDYVIKGVDPLYHGSLLRLILVLLKSEPLLELSNVIDSTLRSFSLEEPVDTKSLADFSTVCMNNAKHQPTVAFFQQLEIAWEIKQKCNLLMLSIAHA
ncbi:hypothetical protein HDE_00490 [Halotydeus destructor]|nr:hypothetical protein HDE_00490 [Halotydeus destructor]